MNFIANSKSLLKRLQKYLYFFPPFVLCLFATKVNASDFFYLTNRTKLFYTQNDETQNDKTAQKFDILPVGVNLGERNIIQSIFVKGYEDGSQAIDFDNWLIPFDDVIQALKLKVTTLDSGELELRNAGLVVLINPDELKKDADLGLVFSVAQIKNLLQVPTEFNLNEYAIVFTPSWLNVKGKKKHKFRRRSGYCRRITQNLPSSLEYLQFSPRSKLRSKI